MEAQDGHMYVGGYLVLPLDPSIWMWSADPYRPATGGGGATTVTSGDPTSAANTTTAAGASTSFVSVIAQYVRSAVLQTRSFLYIVYPVTTQCPKWLGSTTHSRLLFQLYSAASAAAFESENPTLDIRVFPVPLAWDETAGDTSTLTPLQQQALQFLIRLDDTTERRFIESRRPEGPIVCFVCERTAWENAARASSFAAGKDQRLNHPKGCETGVRGSYDGDHDEHQHVIMSQIRHAEEVGTAFLHKLLNATEDLIHQTLDVVPDLSDHFSASDDNAALESFNGFDSAKMSLIFGTFDHLHAGHKFALSLMALLTRQHCCIAVAADDAPSMSTKQSRQLLQPFVLRVSRLGEFMESFFCLLGRLSNLILPSDAVQLKPDTRRPCRRRGCGGDIPRLATTAPSLFISSRLSLAFNEANVSASAAKVEVLTMHDELGLAAYYKAFESLFVTPHSWARGQRFNRARRDIGLSELKLIEVPIVASRDIVVPDTSITDVRLKDPTTVDGPRSPLPPVPPAGLCYGSSDETLLSPRSDKTSSTSIRESVGEQPTMQRLCQFWGTTAVTLEFPPLFTAVWGIHLLECYSVPWRKANRARLVLAMEKIWDQTLSLQPGAPLTLETRGWISVILWLSLVAASSHSLQGEDLQTDNLLSRMKCCRLFALLCSDLDVTGWLASEPLQLSTLWRTADSQLPSLFSDENQVPSMVSPPTVILPWLYDASAAATSAAPASGSVRHDDGDDGVVMTRVTSPNEKGGVLDVHAVPAQQKPQHLHLLYYPFCDQRHILFSSWYASLEFLDLYNNLTEAGLYVVDCFVPQQYRAPNSPPTQRYISSRRRSSSSSGNGGESSSVVPQTRLEFYAKDFLNAHIRIFDLLSYLFFHDSHRTSLESQSIVKILDQLKPSPAEQSPTT